MLAQPLEQHRRVVDLFVARAEEQGHPLVLVTELEQGLRRLARVEFVSVSRGELVEPLAVVVPFGAQLR